MKRTLTGLFCAAVCATVANEAAAGRHIVVGDESQGYVRYIDESNPDNDFSVKATRPVWDLKKVGKHLYRVIGDRGFEVVDLAKREIVKRFRHEKAGGVSAVCDIAGGGFVCVCSAGDDIRLARFNANDEFLSEIFYRGIKNPRKARSGANGEILVSHDHGFARLELPAESASKQDRKLEGRIIKSYLQNREHNSYDAMCARDGNGWWLSSGYGRQIIRFDRDGRQVKAFSVPFKSDRNRGEGNYYAQMEELPNGNLCFANWNGHNREDGFSDWQAVEVDADGHVVWHLHRPNCGSFTGFVIDEDPLPPYVAPKKPFAVFDGGCATPDSMAVDSRGRLLVSAPNFADRGKRGALFRIDNPGDEPYRVCELPVDPESGECRPMGIACGAGENEYFIVDNQPWSGDPRTKGRGKVLRVVLDRDRVKSCETVAEGMEHPNGIRYRDGWLYVTQSIMTPACEPGGPLVSGVYRFDSNARGIKLNNRADDPGLLFTVKTENRFCRYGVDGIAFDRDGNLYVGDFGDGEILRARIDGSGNVGKPELFAKSPFDIKLDPKSPGFLDKATACPMRTTDGMVFGPDGWLYVADFSNNAVACVSPDGKKIEFVRRDADGHASEGMLNQPGEVIFWRGRLIVANFDAVKGDPDKTNSQTERPATLSEIPDAVKASDGPDLSRLPAGSTAVRGRATTPDGRYTYVVHSIARFWLPVTQVERGWCHNAALSVFDAKSGIYVNTVLLDDPDLGAADPWDVAVDSKTIAVAHAGTSEISIIDREAFERRLIERGGKDLSTDLSFMSGIRRRLKTPKQGPRKITLVNGKPAVSAYLQDKKGVTKGELLFNDARRCHQQWQSCASCHPNGKSDGFAWSFPKRGSFGKAEPTRDLTRSRIAKDKLYAQMLADFGSDLFVEPDPEGAKDLVAYLVSIRK